MNSHWLFGCWIVLDREIQKDPSNFIGHSQKFHSISIGWKWMVLSNSVNLDRKFCHNLIIKFHFIKFLCAILYIKGYEHIRVLNVYVFGHLNGWTGGRCSYVSVYPVRHPLTVVVWLQLVCPLRTGLIDLSKKIPQLGEDNYLDWLFSIIVSKHLGWRLC